MLKFPHAGFRRENAEDMKAEGRGKLEARQHQDMVEQALVLAQAACFLGLEAIARLQELQMFDVAAERRVARDTVMVGEGNNGEAARLGLLEDVEIRGSWFLVINRARRMNMEIDPLPRRFVRGLLVLRTTSRSSSGQGVFSRFY
ncbi:MAG: hypothetical protein ACTHMA_19645 [Thermomicrobiales bacterium]